MNEFSVFVKNIEGATHAISGLKASTSVEEFTGLVAAKTGKQADQIQLVCFSSSSNRAPGCFFLFFKIHSADVENNIK
jgi:hypothetical protein